MNITPILISSIVIQFTAAIYALSLVKITGRKYSWFFISLALFFMGARRVIPLHHALADANFNADIPNEIIGLVLSIFMLIGVRGIGPIFVERKIAEQKNRALLIEKETLIRELYHRTRNIMQVIRGLIILQAAEYSSNEEIQRLVEATNSRIEAISLVHHKLYNSLDLSHVSIKEYIEELSSLIMQKFPHSCGKTTLSTRIDNQCFLLDIAIPIGLILNELITNSLKFAFPGNREGEIRITFTSLASSKCILKYSDNGIGVPDDFDFTNHKKTLGLILIHEIATTQLQGKVEMKNADGVTCVIEFDNDLYGVRV
ncbi:MAG: sensor histidine kinase [Spirochaetes bacterium]|nr:MAG: sensor histidine kinase [Spirochaetota bacterium]